MFFAEVDTAHIYDQPIRSPIDPAAFAKLPEPFFRACQVYVGEVMAIQAGAIRWEESLFFNENCLEFC